MPHITEEIWHTLTQKSDEVLALQSYPEALVSGNGEEDAESFTGIPSESSSAQSPPINSESLPLESFLAQTQYVWNQGARFLDELPRTIGQFFNSYQQPLIVVGLLFVAIVALKAVAAIISALNDIPLVSSTFELVGLGYTIWFVYRYLLTSKNRQELVVTTRSLKEQIIGKGEAQPLTVPKTQDAMLSTQKSVLGDRSSKLSPLNGKATAIDPELEQQFELLIGTIRTIRNLRAEADVKPGVKVQVILQSGSSAEREILEAGQSYIQDLAKVETLTITPALETGLKMTMAGVVGTVQVLVPLAGVIDVDARRAKLEKDLGKVEAEIKSLSGRLANPNFVSKAAPEVVQGAKEALAEAQKQAEILRDRLKRLTDNS